MLLASVAKTVALKKLGITQLPKFVTFFVTWRCNSKCVFCDVWKKDTSTEKALSVAEVAGIFAQLKKIDVLRITGGEPFLRKDLAEVVNAADENADPNIIHFTTNGLLTEQIVKTIEKVNSKKKVHIKVSLDNVGEAYDRVRGIPGAYEKAMGTVKALVPLRDKYGFKLGINQAVVDEDDMEGHFKLKEILGPIDVPIHMNIAYEATNSLYSDIQLTDPNGSKRPFGKWSEEGLKKFLNIVDQENKKHEDFSERLVERYRFKGIYNRYVNKKDSPKPDCVALTNHVRILPNGDIPVCLYNGTIVGSLRKESFHDLWFKNAEVQNKRKWVAACSGCWQSCETSVSAVYTGDIWKALFY